MKQITSLTSAILVAFLTLTGVVPALAAETKVTVAMPTLLPALVDSAPGTWPLYKIVYDGTIYELITDAGVQTPVPLTFEKWRDVYRFKSFSNIATDFVKYPWTPTVYAVTFWPGGEAAWQWTQVSFQQWQTAGFPSVRNAGWIKDSYYYQWGTSGEIFVEDGSTLRVNHKLTYAEWQASGFRPFAARSNEGFLKLTWSSEIVRMSNVSAGSGRAIAYAEWAEEAFPSPRLVTRIVGDQFYQNQGEATIWYAGPGLNRPVTFAEWTAAGQPAPTVRGTAPAATIPGNAGIRLVGSQVAAGTYRSPGGAGCYFARLSGLGVLDIIANFLPSSDRSIITILPTDNAFETTECGDWVTATEPASPVLATIPGNGGMFFVGGEVGSGTYSSTGGEFCYWQRLANFTGSGEPIEQSGDTTVEMTVAIAPSDVGFETVGCGDWTKVL